MLDNIDKVTDFKELMCWNVKKIVNSKYIRLMIIYYHEDSASNKKGDVVQVKGWVAMEFI